MNVYFDTVSSIFDGVVEQLLDSKPVDNIYSSLDSMSGRKSRLIDTRLKFVFDPQKIIQGNYKGCPFFEKEESPDEELINSMHPYETEILKMMERPSYNAELFEDRMIKYYRHLAYWNTFLDKAAIQLVIMSATPHNIYHYLVYRLAKIKKIKIIVPTLCPPKSRRFYHFDTCYENNGAELSDLIIELNDKYGKVEIEDIPLSPEMEEEWVLFNRKKTLIGNPSDSKLPSLIYAANYFLKNAGIRKTVRKTLYRLKSDLYWRKLAKFYNDHVAQPNFEEKYIYYALHYQPEATTSPSAGIFVNQYLAVQMLAKNSPADVKIYVKEHPSTFVESNSRTLEQYMEMLSYDSVQFVPMDVNDEDLLSNSLAVASCTGTVLYEAFNRIKPYIMFGYTLMQYSQGVFNVRTNEDCKNAIDYILLNGAKHEKRDVRIFLKAVDMTSYPIKYGWYENLTEGELELYSRMQYEAILEAIRKNYPELGW